MNIFQLKFAALVKAMLPTKICRNTFDVRRAKHQHAALRRHIMAHYQASHDRYASLYERLAK
ncbi:MAG: hypothetical protein H3C28_09250 [Sphingomonadales bacterium]|nr:hypothetical protein [Sphingomonadales bacterium]